MAGRRWQRSKREAEVEAIATVGAALAPSARSHAHTRDRVLSRLDAFSYYAEHAGQFSAGIQAEVKIGEHLGMFNDKGRSDEITLALVSALREAHARLPIAPAPTVIEHRELPEQAT